MDVCPFGDRVRSFVSSLSAPTANRCPRCHILLLDMTRQPIPLAHPSKPFLRDSATYTDRVAAILTDYLSYILRTVSILDMKEIWTESLYDTVIIGDDFDSHLGKNLREKYPQIRAETAHTICLLLEAGVLRKRARSPMEILQHFLDFHLERAWSTIPEVHYQHMFPFAPGIPPTYKFDRDVSHLMNMIK